MIFKPVALVKFPGQFVGFLNRYHTLFNTRFGQRSKSGFEDVAANAQALIIGENIQAYQFCARLGTVIALQKVPKANNLAIKFSHIKPVAGHIDSGGQILGFVSPVQKLFAVFLGNGAAISFIPGYMGNVRDLLQVIWRGKSDDQIGR